MKKTFQSKQSLIWGLLGLFIFSGTYNAIVINSQSSIQSHHLSYSKRLDELYGEVDSKREVAAAIQWQKLSTKQAAIHKKVVVEKKLKNIKTKSVTASSESSSSNDVAPNAAVKEELSLNLVAVSNPKIWQQGITNDRFSGSLETNNGVIESLDVSLPNSGVSVSFSEMTGNVFEYDLNGEVYSGMMYQESSTSYVVNLSNGPLAGTKLTFARELSHEELLAQENQAIELAQSQEADAGVYREEVAQVEQNQPEQDYNNSFNPYEQEQVSYDQQLQQQAIADQQQMQM